MEVSILKANYFHFYLQLLIYFTFSVSDKAVNSPSYVYALCSRLVTIINMAFAKLYLEYFYGKLLNEL